MSQSSVERSHLLSETRKSFNDLFEVLTPLNNTILNKKSGQGWTIGQIFEHILKSQVGMINVLRGNSRTVSRDPLDKRQYFESIFSNDELKLPSGGGVIPDDNPKDHDLLMAKFKSNQKAIEFQISERDMKMEYSLFDHPKFGVLTGAEWVYFQKSHTDRHLRQIRKRLRISN